MQETWVQSLVRVLDPTCHKLSSQATARTWCSQINEYVINGGSVVGWDENPYYYRYSYKE